MCIFRIHSGAMRTQPRSMSCRTCRRGRTRRGGKLNQPARTELFISSSLATQAAKEGIANFECRRLSTTASCVLRNTSRGVGDPAVARACVCRNTSERNITVMCTPQLWNTSRLKLTLHPNGPRGTTAIMTANRTKRIRRSCGCRCAFDGDGFSAICLIIISRLHVHPAPFRNKRYTRLCAVDRLRQRTWNKVQGFTLSCRADTTV